MVRPHSYNQPIVLQNLAPAETLNQVVDALSHLTTIVDDAFGRLSTQIKAEQGKLDALKARVTSVMQKTEKLEKYNSKATTVYSLSKFPAAKEIKEPEPFGGTPDKLNPERIPYGLPLSQRNRRAEDVKTTDLFQKLTGAGVRRMVDDSKEGLGRLPNWLDSVGSTLLFNTNLNPYKAYNFGADNLEGVQGKDREKKVEVLENAPQTIVNGEHLPEFMIEEFKFLPTLTDAPVFNFDQNINFGGVAVAQDMQFGVGFDSLAPSGENAFGGLPSLGGMTEMPGAPAPPPGPAPPAPPPGPVAPAPPPGPAAPPKPAPAPKPKVAKPKPKKSGRASLLDAIRQGKSLNKVAEDEVGKPKKRKGGKGSLPEPKMDMMSMLKMRLAARAKVMAGKGDEDDERPKPQSKPDRPVLDDNPMLSAMDPKFANAMQGDDDESDNEGSWSDE